jgi:hypothetical protein
MGSRERPAAPKKQNVDDDADTTTLKGPKQMDWERRRDSISSPPIQQQQYSFSIGSNHILTEEDLPPISDEHQPLLRTLTRLDDESERLQQAENDVERDLDTFKTSCRCHLFVGYLTRV